jgi:hypothetical protein
MNKTTLKEFAVMGVVAILAVALFNRFAPANVQKLVNG